MCALLWNEVCLMTASEVQHACDFDSVCVLGGCGCGHAVACARSGVVVQCGTEMRCAVV